MGAEKYRFEKNFWNYTPAKNDIQQIESLTSCKLPREYLEFMLKYNDLASPDARSSFGFEIYWRIDQLDFLKQNYQRGWIEDWYIIHPDPAPEPHGAAIGTVLSNIRSYLWPHDERIPKDTIAIGSAGDGNQILLGVAGSNSGKVFFWATEFEAEPGEPTYENVGLLADSFSEFLDTIYPTE